MEEVAVADDLGRVLLDRIARERRDVDIGRVRGVELVVDEQPVVTCDLDILARRHPGRIVVPVQVGDGVRIRERQIAHPYPHHSVALDDGV